MDKKDLLKRRCPEADVELPGVGTVRVRGLTRAQVLEISKRANADNADMGDVEAQGIAWAMVDPELTVDEVKQLFEVAGFAEIQLLNEKINELSGIAGLAQKEAYKSPR